MASIERFPVRTEVFNDMSFHQHIVEEMFSMLRNFGLAVEYQSSDSMQVHVTVTERYDAISDDSLASHAFRLRSIPSIMGTTPEACDLELTSRFLVMQLEYGRCEDEDLDLAIDEDFKWQPYVVAVVDCERQSEPCLMNAQNGKELDGEDVIHVLGIISNMREEYRSALYEGAVECEDGELVNYTELSHGKYSEFDPGIFIERTWCAECQSFSLPCEHIPASLN